MAKSKDNAAAVERRDEPDEQKFTRGQVLSSARYRNRRDVVSALLEDGRMYTIAEVDRMVDEFMKGKVK